MNKFKKIIDISGFSETEQFHNKAKYLLLNVVGAVVKSWDDLIKIYPEYKSIGIGCVECGVIFRWDKAMVEKYGPKKYNVNSYCKNCFNRIYPRYKLWILEKLGKIEVIRRHK